MNNTYVSIPGKLSDIHLYVLLHSNPGEKVLKSIKSRGQICPILLRRKRTFPRGLEINHACKLISEKIPGMLTYVLFMESCQKSICMHVCSPIHKERYFLVFKLYSNSPNHTSLPFSMWSETDIGAVIQL